MSRSVWFIPVVVRFPLALFAMFKLYSLVKKKFDVNQHESYPAVINRSRYLNIWLWYKYLLFYYFLIMPVVCSFRHSRRFNESKTTNQINFFWNFQSILYIITKQSICECALVSLWRFPVYLLFAHFFAITI